MPIQVVITGLTGANTFNATVVPADITANRTYTLPDNSGTILTSASGLNASNLTSGTVPVARLGGGGTRAAGYYLDGANNFTAINLSIINVVAASTIVGSSTTAAGRNVEANKNGTRTGTGWYNAHSTTALNSGTATSTLNIRGKTLRARWMQTDWKGRHYVYYYTGGVNIVRAGGSIVSTTTNAVTYNNTYLYTGWVNANAAPGTAWNVQTYTAIVNYNIYYVGWQLGFSNSAFLILMNDY